MTPFPIDAFSIALLSSTPSYWGGFKSPVINDITIEQTSDVELVYDCIEYSKPIVHYSKGGLVSHIETFTNLGSNWNGPNTEPPSLQTIINTIDLVQNIQTELLNSFLTEEDITPTSHGTIALEFENRKGDIVNIEIGDKFYSVYSDIKDYSRNIEFENHNYLLNFIPQQVVSAIKALY